MNVDDFKRILIAFADDAADLDLAEGTLMVQIRDEVITARVDQVAGELYVSEGKDDHISAFHWLVNRVARVQLLARRVEENIIEEPHFVTPSGVLLDRLDTHPTESEVAIDDVPSNALQILSDRPAGTATVLYLTSDAGEGKTTIINRMARQQARLYKEKKSHWLLLPISLAGRSFLTFDDIVVAELVNRMRFQLFYYEAFLELVKLGVLVPAFDGFEEMFVEGTTGEALSALGNLVNDLESSGTVLVAARKAFFEYQNFGVQAKFLENVQSKSVSFARIGLNRWNQSQFLDYANKRSVSDGTEIYSRIRDRFGPDHPLLTRAVLVKRLIDSAIDGSEKELIDSLVGTKPEDYFFQFVNTLVDREATQKWVDRSGTPRQPLLTVEEHHAMLASIAQEMWISSSEVLRRDYLNVVGELFAAGLDKPRTILRQVVNRIRHHVLISRVPGSDDSYAFDHEDFRRFYLGEALCDTLRSDSLRELEKFLEKASLPMETCDAALNAIQRKCGDLRQVLRSLQQLVDSAPPTSYVVENAGSIGVRLLELLCDDQEVVVRGFTFLSDALRGRRLYRATFEDCQFQDTSLEGTEISKCKFEGCTIYQMEIPTCFDAGHTLLKSTVVWRIVRSVDNKSIFDPAEISNALVAVNFVVESEEEHSAKQPSPPSIDEETQLAERVLRAFMKSTQINEAILRHKFGKEANRFINSVLPKLLDSGVLQEVPFRGGRPAQRRFGIGVPMRQIAKEIPVRVETLDEFLSAISMHE